MTSRPKSLVLEPILAGYLSDLSRAIQCIDRGELGAFANAVHAALSAGDSIYIAGNGGSAAASIHMASDWAAATCDFCPRPRVSALVENVARLTAIANDASYERVFADQLDCARERDVLVVLSVSGDSPNLLCAAEEAMRRGMTVVSALGKRGRCARYSHHTLVLGEGDYGLAEDLHASLSHMIVRALRGGEQTVRDRLDGTPLAACV